MVREERPRLLNSLEEHELHQTLAPKLDGFTNVLHALDPGQLRLLVTFGSIIARVGMRGEADYALANDRLARLTEAFQADHPECRCLCIEWSIWSGVGMGERLGRVEALIREGILPITRRRCRASARSVAVSLTNATHRCGKSPGNISDLETRQPDLPFFRFLSKYASIIRVLSSL